MSFWLQKRKFSILDDSRVEANPPHPNIKVEVVAHEAVVNYREWAATKQTW